MRALPLLLALLVTLAPISVAEDSSSGEPSGEPSGDGAHSSNSTASGSPAPDPQPGCPSGSNSTEAQREACKERYCAEHPRDPRCPRHDAGNETHGDMDSDEANNTDDATGDSPKAAAYQRWCRAPERTAAESERCARVLRAFLDGGDERWVTFHADTANLTLTDLRVSGRQTILKLAFDAGSDNVSVERTGRVLRIGDNNTELAIHDDPAGLLRFKGLDGEVVLAFPAGATGAPHGEGYRIHYADGRDGLLVAENATWLDSGLVRLHGFWTFHLPPRGEAAPEQPPKAAEAQERVQEAIGQRNVAAEVSLRLPQSATAASAFAGPESEANQSVQVLAYDDVDVLVDTHSLADPDVPIRIEVSSELTEGRTLVIHLDDSLLASARPGDLRLRYFDLHNQTDGSVFETEVVLAMASGLTDILDPMDDGGQPEYWVVQDAGGLQVLFSVPHWSVHAITIQSLGIDVPPSVAYGVIGGVVASVAAAAVMFRPRRDEDEF